MSLSSQNGWEVKPLIEIATLQRGYDLPVDDRVSGGVPVFAANGQVGSHNEAKAKGPGVVTGRSGSIGKVHFVESDYWPLNTSLYVKDFHGNDPKFIYYMLSNMRLERYSEGTGVPTLNRNNVHDVLVSLPPLDEQRRIAAILDKADAIRRKRQESIRLTEEFLRSTFLEMFGDPVTNPRRWAVADLGSIAQIQGGLQVTTKRSGNPLEIPYLRVANVYRDRLDLTEMKTMPVTHAELERVKLAKGDILIVEGHGNPEEIGRSSVWDASINPCIHQNHLIRVRVDSSVADPIFISAYLNSSGGRQQLFSFGKTTSGLNTISTSNVKNTKVLLPPLSMQKMYHQIVERTKEVLAKANSNIEFSDHLFNSLTHRAFRGEL